MTAGDDRILETLDDSGLALSPSVLAYNIDYTRNYVSKRLRKLMDAGLITKVDDGLYEITEFGEKYVHGELSADDIDLEDL